MQGLELEDIQGIILHGYGRLAGGRYLLLEIEDPVAARAWLQTLDVRNAQRSPSVSDVAVNVAFTRAGLERLNLPPGALETFAGEFCQGMTATSHRQRILGDLGESAPENWQWGGPNSQGPHLLLMLFAADETQLASLVAAHQASLSAHGMGLVRELSTRRLPARKEHFGFRDGIAQPSIEGFNSDGESSNTIAAGEFILGYPNAYGQHPQSPLVSASADTEGRLPEALGGDGQRDLGRNGSYLVFRQLAQDVGGFWRYLEANTVDHDGGSDPAARTRLAAKMVGRWPSGAPLVEAPDSDDPSLARSNAFLYHRSGDAHGLRCPIGSHIRRTNPRDALDPEPGSERSIEVGKRHRILRRGRAYGPPLAESMEPADILAAQGEDGERGLHFICFNTHIARQFEFIQHTWVNNPKFDGLYEDDDPLIGDRGGHGRSPGGAFTIQAEPVRQRVTQMPRFVQVVGGGYFFMPGIRALRFLATLT